MKKIVSVIIVLLFAALAFPQSKIENLRAHVEYLASDSLKGRLAGSAEEKVAARYIAEAFEKQGIPRYKNSYLKPFVYTVGNNPHNNTDMQNATKVTAVNVAAFIDNKAAKTMIIGAHFDHIGKNERGYSTLPGATDAVHNGADDNASGVAGLIELARLLAHNNIQEKTNFLFISFSGEEDGLRGSKHIVQTLQNDGVKMHAMLNMDMIGRMDSTLRLYIGGTGTSSSFNNTLKRHDKGFQLVFDESGIGPSDYTSFYLQNIPVLAFFTGLHTDYHKPSDDVEKINFTQLTKIVDYIYPRLRIRKRELKIFRLFPQ